MEESAPRGRLNDTRLLRRILIAIGLVLAALILVVVAIYAGAFIMLAPLFHLRDEPGTARHQARMNARHPSINDYRGPAPAAPAPVTTAEGRP